MNLCCLGNTRRHLTRCFLGSICLLLLRLSGRDWCADSVGQNVWVVLPGLSQRKVDVWFCLPLRICIFLCIACFLFKIRIPTKEFKFNHSAGKSDRHGWLYKSVPRLSQRFKHTNFSSKIPSPWQSTPQLLLTSLHSSAFWLTRPIPKTSTFQTFSQKQPTFKNTQKKTTESFRTELNYYCWMQQKSPHNHSGCSKMLVPKKSPIFPHLWEHGIFVHQPFFGPPNYGTLGLPLRRCRLRCRRLGSSFLLPPALFLLHFVQKIPLLSGKTPRFFSTHPFYNKRIALLSRQLFF